MKKVNLLIFIILISNIIAQVRVSRDYRYENGDTYYLHKDNNILSMDVSSNNTSWANIGSITTNVGGGGTLYSESMIIRVINLVSLTGGEDPKANNATNPAGDDLAILEISLSNPYQDSGYDQPDWGNNYYDIVLLNNDIINETPENQWAAVINGSVILSKKYSEAGSYNFMNHVNAGNSIITIGIKPQVFNNRNWASCDGAFRFKGNVLVDEPISIIVENFFSDGSTTGKIKAQANSYPTFESNSPVYFNNIMTRTNVYAEALDKPTEGYCFNDSEAPLNKSSWQKADEDGAPQGALGDTPFTFNQIISTNSGEKNYHYRALMKKYLNPTFQNYFIGVGNGGIISVKGSALNSPSFSTTVIELNGIDVSAQNQTINGISYTFTQWNDGNLYSYRTFYPSSNNTYTANFIGRPVNENFTFGTTVGAPVVINWTDNTNTDVTQYQIWRKVKHNGVMGSPELLTTVGRGVQTYTDDLYLLTSTYSNDLLYYDVRAYYDIEETYSTEDWRAVYGEINWSKDSNENIAAASLANEVPTDYSISNYPNPFNPTTVINYQLPKDGFVTLKVYNVLGKEIATLVNSNKNAGYYNVEFDASNLPSGVYIYSINANGFKQSKKMILTK